MKVEKCFVPHFSYGNGHKNAGYFYNSYYDNNLNTKEFLKEEELHSKKKQLETLLSNEGKGVVGNVLYVGKGSNVPRHKIKMFIEENKIKKTTIIENSDTVIFDKKIIKDVHKWISNFKEVKIAIVPITKAIADEMIRLNSLSNNTYQSQNYHRQVSAAVMRNANMILYYDEWSAFPQSLKNIIPIIEWIDCYEQDNYRTKNIQDVFDTVNYYSENPHGNIIWDDVILETLNSEGIDLDEDYVDTLNSMFASNDNDNIKLALEMMSNVNLEKHGLVIALLLNKWKGVMSWGNGNTGGQAYKTLDRYFRNKGINWKIDYRTFTTGLFKNYTDEESREIIADFLLRNINSFLSENNFRLDGEFLQIDSFKISKYKK